MTLTLILTRHAKSSWDDLAQDDFDRPLNGRGRKAAPAIGAWLAENGYLPDEVVVSGARRTVETWSRMASELPETATMQSNPALYEASSDTIFGVIRSLSSPTVMLIGHNPGMGTLASRLVSAAPAHPKFAVYPTGATTVMTFDASDWKDIEYGSGRIADFAIPRELTG